MGNISGKSPFYEQGLRFACLRCSACCRHEPGYVFLSEKDSARLMHALNMDYREFTETYCRWISSLSGAFQLSLKEKANYDCIFWISGSGVKQESGQNTAGFCSVYEARPLQCRAFPFWQSILNSMNCWNAAAEDCPGINRGALTSCKTIKKWLAARQSEPIISRSAKNIGEKV